MAYQVLQVKSILKIMLEDQINKAIYETIIVRELRSLIQEPSNKFLIDQRYMGQTYMCTYPEQVYSFHLS
jgi:hypothetical protein